MKIKILQDCHGDTEGGFDYKEGDEQTVSARLGKLLIGFGYAAELPAKAEAKTDPKADPK